MAESRLFRILYLLLEKGSTTAPELARLFEVSVRTIYRDIERIVQFRRCPTCGRRLRAYSDRKSVV